MSEVPPEKNVGFETLFVNNRATSRRLRKARLVVIDGPDRGKVTEMERPRVTIGRSVICELAVTDRSVSGTHAEIEAIESGYVVRDLGSTNGCYIGDVRIKEATVPLGTRLRMGTTTIQVEPADGTVDIPLSATDRFYDLVGRSVAMRQIFAQLEKVAPSDLTILVTGETGTGKELISRAIHQASKRGKGPLIVQDCSAMPSNLVESTLFGHERGSFTGATDRHHGSFEQASGGTLFLDEVGELPMEQQAKLLRVLEQREIRRVGGEKTIAVDVRVVAATNRDLRVMVSAGTFREDLYFRLAVLSIEVPPLRERPEDIELLFLHFLPEAKRAANHDVLKLDHLIKRPWKGNVRELRNFTERVAALGLMEALYASDDSVRGPRTGAQAAVGTPGDADWVPADLLRGPYKVLKNLMLVAWERQYLRALAERHGGKSRAMAAEAEIVMNYLWKLVKSHEKA